MKSQPAQNTTQKQLAHPLLSRLIKEVENERTLSALPGRYDRTHNRHNRGQ